MCTTTLYGFVADDGQIVLAGEAGELVLSNVYAVAEYFDKAVDMLLALAVQDYNVYDSTANMYQIRRALMNTFDYNDSVINCKFIGSYQ